MKAGLLFLVVLVLALVPNSYQYGSVFVDTVFPVKDEFVHITDTHSDTITAGIFQVQTMTLTDPGGFQVHLPISIDITSEDSLSLNGELGISLGGPEADLVSLSADHDMTLLSEDFFFSANNINFSEQTSVDFATHREFYLNADGFIDFDSSLLMALQSVIGNTQLTSPEIFATGPSILGGAEQTFLIDSRTGFVNIQTGSDTNLHSDELYFRSQQKIDFLADNNFNITAEDLVRVDAGLAKFSALGDMLIFSNRSVDVNSPSLVSASASHIGWSGSEILVSVQEDDLSQLTTFSKDTITFKSLGDSDLTAQNIHLIASERVVLIANVLNWNAIEDIRIGSDATNNVDFDADEHFLEFTLLEDSGDELLFDASRQLLFNAINIVGFEGANMRIAGSSVVGTAKASTFTATDIHITSRSEVSVDDNFFKSINGQTFSIDHDLNVDARELDYVAPRISQTATEAIQFHGDHFLVLQAGTDITITAQNSIISGGNIDAEIDGDVLIRPQANLGRNPDVKFAYLKNNDIYADSYIINTSGDISYTTNFGDLNINVLNDMYFTAVQELNIFTDGGASFIVHGGDVPFSAQRDILIRNGLVDPLDLASFTFGEDIAFTAPTISISSDQKILSYASTSIHLTSETGVESSSQALRYLTLIPGSDSGVVIHAKNDLVQNSGSDITWDSGNDLLVHSVTGYVFTTPLIELAGTEDVSIISGRDTTFDLTSGFDVDSDGYVFTTAHTSFALTVETGPLAFSAVDSINSTTLSYYDWRSVANAFVNGGYFTSFSQALDLRAVTGSASVAAGNTEGSVTIKAHQSGLFTSLKGQNQISAPEISFYAGGDMTLQTSANTNIAFIADNSHLELQPIIATVPGAYTTKSGTYSFTSFEFGAYYDATASSLLYRAQDAVYITSDGDLTFAGPTSPFVARASNNWEAVSEDSSEFSAGGSLSILAPAGKHVIIASDGRTGFKSRTSDVAITSASYLKVDAGRIVMDAFKSGATFLATNDGDITIGSTHGSVRLESSDTITSVNQDSHIFTSTSGVDMTANAGLYFYLEGVLPGSPNAIEFQSSDLYGDIVFDSQLSGYTLVALKDIIYTAANNISLTSAQGAQFLADTDLTWDAPHGSFDVNGAAGISILAGNGVDPADVTFTQAKGAFLASAGEQIKFHSTGVVEQTAILISAVSDIRFATGNSGDITFQASGLLDVFANGYITAQATNNLNVESTTDSVTINAVTGGDFETKGGPIRFTTFTNANGGNINLSASSGDITFTSGNSTRLFSRGATAINAQTGIGFTSVDGSLQVTAESATSYINLLSAGGLQVRSSGSRRVPEDGLIFQAANNIVFGTPTTKTIAFNAGNNYIVGETTRPIISFNAGGGVGVDGFTIDSDGGIYTASQNDFLSDIGGNLEVDTHFVIGSVAGGPMQITSGKAMFVNADAGIVEMSAQTFYKLTSGDSVTGTTAGSLELISVGAGPQDQMLWIAPKVTITTGTHQLMATTLDADITNSFTLTTSGTGVIRGGLDSESHVLFDAAASFKGTSNGLLSLITLEDNGPITIHTDGTGSDIFITTDVQSDFELGAGGDFTVYASTLTLSGESFSFRAIDTSSHTDRTNGDIQIGAQSNIVGVAQQDMFLAGARSVLIQTVGATAGVGAPLSITATGDISMNANGDFLIANVPQEGGSLAFSSLTDVLIENSDANAFVNVVSDSNESWISTRDEVVIVGEGFYTLAGDQTVLTANGRDSNDGFGIHWITTESLNADITFQAIFGSVQFTAGTSISVNADGHPGDSGHDIIVTSDHSGTFRGKTGTTLTTVNDVAVTARQGRITLDSATGIEVNALTTGLQSTPDILFQSNGVDDNGEYSIRFQETGGFPIQLNVGADLSIDADEDVFLLSPTISLTATTSMSFDSAEASILFNGETTEVFSDVIDYEAQNILFETDYFHINAQAGLNYKATNGDLLIETNGLHANIDMYASAGVEFTSTNSNIDIVTARRPDANVNIISSLGRIEFNPRVNSNHEGFSIDFLAENGDLTFDGQGDDADVYVTVQSVVIEAEGGVQLQSIFPADPLIPAVIVTAGITNVQTESDFILEGNILNINAPVVQFLSNPNSAVSDYGEGGTATVVTEDDFDVTANQLTIATYTQGDLLVIGSDGGDVIFNSPLITISTDAVMKIPYNNNLSPFFDPGNFADACVDREFFAFDALVYDQINGIDPPFPVDGDNSWLLLCVCDAGVPFCVPFPEPPCDPNDLACPGFNYV